MKKILNYSLFTLLVLSAALQAQQPTPAASILSEVPASNFIELPLSGTTVPFGEVYGGATLAKQGSLCLAQGLVKQVEATKVFAAFPEGYRPVNKLIFGLNSHAVSCRVDLTKEGAATVFGTPTNGWVSLSGMIFSPTAGTPITLNAPWVNFSTDGTFASPVYNKEGNIVVLSGLVKGGTTGIIGVLPEGARPTARLNFHTDKDGKSTRVMIYPNGEIRYEDAATPWISLSGIAFSTVAGTGLTLEKDWTNLVPATFGGASVSKDGNICLLQGVVTNPMAKNLRETKGMLDRLNADRTGILRDLAARQAQNDSLTKSVNDLTVALNESKIAQLPDAYKPARRLIFNATQFGSSVRIDIKTDGGVYLIAGSSDSENISLSNIVYALPDKSGTPSTPAPAVVAPVVTPVVPVAAPAPAPVVVPVTPVVPAVVPAPVVASAAITPILSEVPAQNFQDLKLEGTTVPFGDIYGGAVLAHQGTLCLVQGLVKSIETTKPFATFPAWAFPVSGKLIFGLNSHAVSCRIDLSANEGSAKVVAGVPTNGWVSLSGMIYSPKAGTPIELKALWVAFSTGADTEYTMPVFNKEGNIVVLSGLVKSTGGSGIIGVLPEGARPTTNLVFNTSWDGASKRVDIRPNGEIFYQGTVPGWLSLSGIAFSTVAGAKVELATDFTEYYPETWGPVTAVKNGNICMLQGLVNKPGLIELQKAQQSLVEKRKILQEKIATEKKFTLLAWDKISRNNEVKAAAKDFVDTQALFAKLSSALLRGETKIAQLPNEFWPVRRLIFNTNRNTGNARIDVKVDGGVYWVAGEGAPDWLSLSNIVYALPATTAVPAVVSSLPAVTTPVPAVASVSLVTAQTPAAIAPAPVGVVVTPFVASVVALAPTAQPMGSQADAVEIQKQDIVPQQQQGVGSTAPSPSVTVAVQRSINLPTGFVAEEGKVKRISVGSRNGELEAWAIGFDDQLYRYSIYSMGASPWVKQEFKDMKFEDVSCASDGTMVALNADGKALKYDWDKKEWMAIEPGKGNEDLNFEFITIGNKDSVWAVDVEKKTIYALTTIGALTSWQVRAPGNGVYVAAGVDGTVVALDQNGRSFQWIDDKWDRMPGAALIRVAVGNKDNIIGCDKNNNLLECKDGKWREIKGIDGKIATGFDEISINAAGTIFAADDDGDVYINGDAGVVVTAPKNEEVKPLANQVTAVITDIWAGKKVVISSELAPILVSLGIKGGNKPSAKAIMPTAKKIEAAIKKEKTKAVKVAPKTTATRAAAKVTGKVAKKSVKVKTTGTAPKVAAKAKKGAKAAAKPVAKKTATKATAKKAVAKKPVAKKAVAKVAVNKVAEPVKAVVTPAPVVPASPAPATV